MIRHHRTSSGYSNPEPDLDAFVLRMRRLMLHRGFDRGEIGSPMLKRLMPTKAVRGEFPEADLRRRIKEAQLDANAFAYLLQSLESELDYARLRLT